MSRETTRDALPFEQTPYLETIEEMASKQLACAIVNYAFCCEPVGSTRPNVELADRGMAACARDRMAEIIALYRKNEWQSLFAILGASFVEGETLDDWDDSKIALDKLTSPEFIKAQHDLMSASNQGLLESLNEKLLWQTPVAGDEGGCLFDEKRLPSKEEITEAVSTYVGMQQRFSNNGMEMTRYMIMANHYRSQGSETKALLADRVANAIQLASLNLYSLTEIAFVEMIACLKMAQKLPPNEQKRIFGYDLSGCDLDKLRDKEACDLGVEIGVKFLTDGAFTPCKGFDYLCKYLAGFFGLAAN